MNAHFMKKIPKGAEASNILVGELNVLDKPLSAFIRLSEAVVLGDLTEVPVPTRFIFILLGPAVSVFWSSIKAEHFCQFRDPAKLDLSELFFGRLKGYVDFFCHFLLSVIIP
jgi:hypothetical protein